MYYNRCIPGTSKYSEARQKEILFKKSSLLKNNTKTKPKQQQQQQQHQQKEWKLDGKKGIKDSGNQRELLDVWTVLQILKSDVSCQRY